MALNAKTVGYETKPIVHTVNWRDTALYALGVGAKTSELDFLYEGRGPKILPTYAVIPTFPACMELMMVVGGDMLGVVHGGQTITLKKPFRPGSTLSTVGKVAGLYDLKRMATGSFTTITKDETGDVVCETEWSIIFRNDGGFGGETPPKTPKVHTPEREPDFRVEESTTQEQALLYRLSGDINPLHADPAIGEKAGFGKPILHGLCTYGYAGRAVMQAVCGGDPSRLKEFSGQFRKPVWPGETLVTEGFKEDGRVIVQVSTKERPGEYVFSNAYAVVQ